MAVACELQFQWKSVILKVKAMRLKVKMNRCYLMLPNVVCFAQRKKDGKYQKKCQSHTWAPRHLEKVLLDTGDKHLVAATAPG